MCACGVGGKWEWFNCQYGRMYAVDRVDRMNICSMMVCVCMHAYVYIYICVCMYVCVSMCVCVCMCVFTSDSPP